MRQNSEKNVEKIVAITLSLGMVALNVCSNGDYSYKFKNTSSDKSKTAYASGLSDHKSENSIECAELEVEKVGQKREIIAPAIISEVAKPSPQQIKVLAKSKVETKDSANSDMDIKKDDNTSINDETDVWDKLIKDYEEYEILDIEHDEEIIPDATKSEPEYYVDEPDAEQENVISKPEISETVDEDIQPIVENTDNSQLKIDPDPAQFTDSISDIPVDTPAKVKPAMTKSPVVVENSFGQHIKIADTVREHAPDGENSKVVITSTPDLTGLRVRSPEEFLSEMPDVGVNGFTKDRIRPLLYSGLGVLAAASLIGAPYLVYKAVS